MKIAANEKCRLVINTVNLSACISSGILKVVN